MKQAVKILHASAYLTRFDPPPPANDAPKIIEPTPPAEFDDPQAAPSAQIPSDNHTASAIDADALSAQFEARLEMLLADEKARAAAELEQARANWMTMENERLAVQINAAITRGFTEIRDDIAHTLRPLIADAVKSETLQGFIDAILTCLPGEPVATIEIRGPTDLIERIRSVVEPLNISVRTCETVGPDVSVDFGVTKIATRLSSGLSELLNERSVSDERK